MKLFEWEFSETTTVSEQLFFLHTFIMAARLKLGSYVHLLHVGVVTKHYHLMVETDQLAGVPWLKKNNNNKKIH